MGFFKRILPPKIDFPDHDSFVLDDWRLWFGNVLALAFTVLYPLAALTALPVFLANEQYGLIALDAGLWLLLILRAFLPNNKLIRSRALWVAVLYLMTVSFLIALGPAYARSAWLVFCAVAAALFYGTRGALGASGCNALLLLCLYWILDSGNPAWAETYRLGVGNWIMFVSSTSLLSVAASLPVGFLLSRLDRGLRREKVVNEQLALERSQLGRANEALQSQMRERALAQLALKESEQKLRLMADNLPDAVIYQVTIGADGGRRFNYVSKSVERLNEVTVEAVLNDAATMYGQVDPECLPELMAMEKRALENRTTFRHTIKCVLPSGKVRWFDLASTPHEGPDGQVIWDGVQVDVTEREQAKEALRESESIYRALVENSHDGILLLDMEFHFTYVNDEFCSMIGYSPEEVLGQDFRRFLAEETAHIPVDSYLAKLRGEDPSPVYEFMVQRKDGQKRWVEVKSSEFMDAKGEVFFMGQLLDITERKAADEALRQSENLHRALVEHSHAGIALFDENFRFNYVNDEFCKMVGYSQEELLGRDGRTFLAGESVQMVSDNFLARRRGEYVPERYDIVGVRKDGQERWLEVSASILTSPMGREQTLAQFLDITDRKLAEEALKESESRYRALVENSHSGIVLIDDDHRYVYANDEYCKTLGYPREEILGRDFREFLAEESAQMVEDHYQARQRGENPPPRYEYLVKRKEGKKRWVEVSASVITDAKGKVFTVAQLLDITERKQVEAALKQSESRYRALVEHSHAGIGLLDDSFCFNYVNDELCKMSGYSRDELLGMDGRTLVAAESVQTLTDNFRARRRGEPAPERYDVVGVRKDGERRWVEISSSVITDSKGVVCTISQFLDITERKLADEALRQSESRYRALVEHSHAGIILIDDGFRFSYVNDEFCRILGYTQEELLGQDFRQYLAEETAHIPAEHYLARRRGEDPPNRYEFMATRKDGEKRWLETSSSVITDSKGRTQTIAQLLDITERKRAEEALRQSEERFRASFDSAFQFSGLLSPEGMILEGNQASLDFVGVSLEDVLGMPFWKAKWWQSDQVGQARVKDAIRRAAAGEFMRFEAEHIGVGNRKIIMDFSIKPVLGPEGEVTMLLAEGFDITDRIRAEEALRESEEKFRQVIQATPMGVHMYELNERDRLVFMGANPAADHMLGIKHDELVGLDLEEALPGLMGTQVPNSYREVAAKGGNWYAEVIDYQDERMSGSFEVYAFQTAPGKLTAMFQDITGRKKAERDKARLESQLRQSQKMEALGTLSGGIAHDFNNILGAILGTAEASLLKGNDFDSLAVNMGNIRDMTIRGRDLVHRLMAFSRQDEQAVRTLDLAEVINDALALIRATLPPNVEIRKDLARGILVTADTVQIQQVIMNLCTNAAQAMEDGGGMLSVRLRPQELSEDQARLHPGLEAGPHALCEVSDTGHGISADTQERIFEPFFTTKPMGRGTGLGLSLVHGIVRSHGGAISASSRQGQGTTMSVLLPLAHDQASDQAAAPKSSALVEGRGEYILVVDDEDIIARTLAQSLGALGYRVAAYSSALEAAAVLESDPARFDMIITDHMMPGLTGRQLAEIASELRPGLPVVLMTGMTGDHDEFLKDGFVSRVLTKPLTIKEIGEAVQQVLNKGKQGKTQAKT